MYKAGDRVRYAGNIAEVKDMTGVVKGPGSSAGRYMVEWLSLGSTVDMSDTVLSKDSEEGSEAMPKARKTVVTHPDGTQSTRNSGTMIYTYAVEGREDRWAYAKLQHAAAADTRAAKAKFIEAVRGGKVVTSAGRVKSSPDYAHVYVEHASGERFYIGSQERPTEPLDRKQAVRDRLAEFDSMAAAHERDAREAEAGPQYAYGVWRWSQNHENATKAMRDFERNHKQGITTFRVVPAEAAE